MMMGRARKMQAAKASCGIPGLCGHSMSTERLELERGILMTVKGRIVERAELDLADTGEGEWCYLLPPVWRSM